jgi:hypothetical protein
MSAPDPIRRLRQIAAEAADHAVFADGPVTPDADLLDLCAEALHLLRAAETAKALARSATWDPDPRSEWNSQRREEDCQIKKAGIYAKALVVNCSVTGAAVLAKMSRRRPEAS